MIKRIILLTAILAAAVSFAVGQVPLTTQISIVKAEDARRYDKSLESLLKNSNPKVRERAALAAGRIGQKGAVAALIEMMEKDASVAVRAIAVFAIGEIESTTGADALIRTLVDGAAGSSVKARAIEAAGKIASANPVDPKTAQLRKAILAALDAEDAKREKQDRDVVLLGLTAALRAASRDTKRTRPDETDTIVAKFLKSTDAHARAAAANTLTRVRAKNANAVLRKIVASDVDPVARANAARALGAAEDIEALDLLIDAATEDRDERVRVSAIRSLATLKEAKAAPALLTRAETLLATYKRSKRAEFIPSEQNEFLEIATALGRLLTNSRDERAVNLLREFGRIDQGFATEAYIARLRIAPGKGDNDKPELTHWRQYSTLAQVAGEFATLEPTNDEGKRMKSEAPDILRPLAKAYAEADPVTDADTIKAGPDVLRAYAAFKPEDLAPILLEALKNKDVFIRAAAAELLSNQTSSPEAVSGLRAALISALETDKHDNDAQLAIMEALASVAMKDAMEDLRETELKSPDYLVRVKAAELRNMLSKNGREILVPTINEELRVNSHNVRPYDPSTGTKLGQILNSDADYRRALGRKNGTVSAVVATAKGSFTIEFLPEDAPLTVDNFIKLARAKYFNGLEVHRVVPNFVMQDGDPRGDGNGGPGWSIRCELNMIPYERGAVGMALSGKDTGGSQWFVTHSPQPHLDGGYTVFGRVNEIGMKVVDKIVRGDKIVSVRIVERPRGK